MTLRQWIVIEILALANLLAGAVAMALLMAHPAADVFSHNLIETQVVELAGPTASQLPNPTSTPAATQTSVPTQAPSETATLLPTQTPTVGPTLTASMTPTSVAIALSDTPAPTSTPAPTVSIEYQLTVVGRQQSLPLSCESRSAADWAGYFGVAIDELEFFGRLPVSDNPEVGFVGDVNGRWGQVPPNAYGVHAAPVAALLRDYGVNAVAHYGMTWEEAQAEIAAGRPVLVWVVGHVWEKGHPLIYTAQDGSKVLVAPYEHTVLLVGYNDTVVYISDEGNVYTRPIATFLGSWGALGNMAIAAG